MSSADSQWAWDGVARRWYRWSNSAAGYIYRYENPATYSSHITPPVGLYSPLEHPGSIASPYSYPSSPAGQPYPQISRPLSPAFRSPHSTQPTAPSSHGNVLSHGNASNDAGANITVPRISSPTIREFSRDQHSPSVPTRQVLSFIPGRNLTHSHNIANDIRFGDVVEAGPDLFLVTGVDYGDLKCFRIIQKRDISSSSRGERKLVPIYSGRRFEFPRTRTSIDISSEIERPLPFPIRVHCKSYFKLPSEARLDLETVYLLRPEQIDRVVGDLHDTTSRGFSEETARYWRTRSAPSIHYQGVPRRRTPAVITVDSGTRRTSEDQRARWTEVSKDLVSKEAIKSKNYVYSESENHYYIHEYLRYEDVQDLVEISRMDRQRPTATGKDSHRDQKPITSGNRDKPRRKPSWYDVEPSRYEDSDDSYRRRKSRKQRSRSNSPYSKTRRESPGSAHTTSDSGLSPKKPLSSMGNSIFTTEQLQKEELLKSRDSIERQDLGSSIERPTSTIGSVRRNTIEIDGESLALEAALWNDSQIQSRPPKEDPSKGSPKEVEKPKLMKTVVATESCTRCGRLKMKCEPREHTGEDGRLSCTNCFKVKIECKGGKAGFLDSKSQKRLASRSAKATIEVVKPVPLTKPSPTSTSTDSAPWLLSQQLGEPIDLRRSILDQTKPNDSPYISPEVNRPKILPVLDDFDNLDALLNPTEYFSELDSLELEVVEKCHVQSIFPQPSTNSSSIEKSGGLLHPCTKGTEFSPGTLARDQCRTVLYGIMAAFKLMKTQEFCKDAINIIVQDPGRPNVVRVIDIQIDDVEKFSRLIDSETTPEMEMTARRATVLLWLFGVHTSPVKTHTQARTAELASLLCSLLALATVSYAGSHCQDIGQSLWSTPLESITFDSVYTARDRRFKFYKQRLTCLGAFIGGPVWVFGDSGSKESLLSISVLQLADLWGPIIAVPSPKGFEELILIQSEGGLMFQSRDPKFARSLEKDEILVHWISSEPPRKKRKDFLGRMFTSSKKGERLPEKLEPFPANAHLLIGHPPVGSTATVTANTPGLILNRQLGLRVNKFCQLDLDRYAEENAARLHLIGTWDESYVPDQLQVALSGGQYVNVGIQKVWKRRPACTLKSRLLLAFSNPRVRASTIRDLLNLYVGFEQSACTGNAKRITLKQALIGAYAFEAPAIEDACSTGNSQYLLEFITELGFTGIDTNSALLLFWPFDYGQDALELKDNKPAWRDLLKDTRDSACFAFISPRCLTYQGRDDVKARSTRMLCSLRPANSDRPVFQTAIDLDPKAKVTLPLEKEARMRLADGFLEIRNCDAGCQLAVYGRRGLLSMIEEMAICARDGKKGHNHREMVAAQRASRYTVPVCIVDR